MRGAIEAAARDLALAGAIVEPLAPFLTQEMLDGLDRFWRMRSLIDIRALAAGKAREDSALHPGLGGIGVVAFRPSTCFTGFSQIMAMRKAAVAATDPFDFVLSPTAPMTAYAAEWPSPSNDPLDPFPAYRLYRRLQHVGTAGRLDQLRL